MKIMIQNKICECCGKLFKQKYRVQRFCCRSCSAKITNKERGTRTSESRKKVSESLRKYYNSQKSGTNEIYEDQICKYCGNPIKSITKKKDFCSYLCRTQYYYEQQVKNWLDNPSSVNTTYIPKFIKRWLKETRGEQCEICGWHEINEYTGLIPLQIHHIDGDCTNNHPNNLKMLCPNCHSLTNNFCSRNIGKSKRNRK